MATKRSGELEANSGTLKSAKLESLNKGHSYKGYRIQSNLEKLDRISISDITKEEFQTKYLLPHKPCIITGVIPDLNIEEFEVDKIAETLSYDEELQVEKKIDGGFGSGQERLKMKFDEFLGKVVNGDDSLYLTTQYTDDIEDEEEDDDDDEENEKGFLPDGENFSDSDSIDMNNLQDDFVDSEEEIEEEGASILQPPLTNSLDIPLKPLLFDILTTQQINLWIGSTSTNSKEVEIDIGKPNCGVGRNLPNCIGSSSGLHHDHSDNLYIPIKGKKRFTLFSPYDADSLYTVGDINKIYENGVIDYVVNENAPNWNHVRSDGIIIEAKEIVSESKQDPPSFSKIPPYFVHLDSIPDSEPNKKFLLEEFKTKFPKLQNLNKIEVEISKGEMLFLPCGWFHEVTSYGVKDRVHIAMNYWFLPSDNMSLDKPYLHSA